jgi:hypothetical protein
MITRQRIDELARHAGQGGDAVRQAILVAAYESSRAGAVEAVALAWWRRAGEWLAQQRARVRAPC